MAEKTITVDAELTRLENRFDKMGTAEALDELERWICQLDRQMKAARLIHRRLVYMQRGPHDTQNIPTEALVRELATRPAKPDLASGEAREVPDMSICDLRSMAGAALKELASRELRELKESETRVAALPTDALVKELATRTDCPWTIGVSE